MNDKKHPELAKSNVIKHMPEACGDETAAVEFFERHRWGNSPICPHCQSPNVYKLKGRVGGRNKRYLWRCRACGEQYTVRTGTIYEDSKLPLRHWAYGLGSLKAAMEWLEKAIDVAGKEDIRAMALEDPDLEPLWTKIGEI